MTAPIFGAFSLVHGSTLRLDKCRIGVVPGLQLNYEKVFVGGDHERQKCQYDVLTVQGCSPGTNMPTCTFMNEKTNA